MTGHGPELLKQFEHRWETDMGKWFPGERVIYRGKDLFADIQPMGLVGLLTYGVTGRVFSRQQIALFESILTITGSFPDPRLWNNRIAALAGTARSTANLGISAASAVSEATVYGHRPIIKAYDFLQRAKDFSGSDDELIQFIRNEFRSNKTIAGFGRPVTKIDERINPLLNAAEKAGIERGEYVELAFRIENLLVHGRYRMGMNIAGLAAALVADQGVSAREYSRILVSVFLGGFLPCFLDTENKPEGVFFPFSTKRIEYKGRENRTWTGER